MWQLVYSEEEGGQRGKACISQECLAVLVKLDRVLESGAVGRVPVEHLLRPDYRRLCTSFVHISFASFLLLFHDAGSHC